MSLDDPSGLCASAHNQKQCLQQNYGGLYEFALDLSPFSLLALATNEASEYVEDNLSRQANRNLYSNSSSLYETGKRQAKTLAQFRRFNAAMAVASALGAGFVIGANAYCFFAGP